MSNYQGFGSLRSPKDLLGKLKRDFEALEKDANNSDLAFNFFITALHMLDWLHPNDPGKRTAIERSEILLQVCSHIANGAKHFEATNKKHTSVDDVNAGGSYLRSNDAGNGAVFLRSNVAGIMIDLQGDAANKLGTPIQAHVLASKILEFWKNHPDVN